MLHLLVAGVVLLNSSTAILVVNKLAVLVPLMLSITALLEFLIGYMQLETIIPATNASNATLVNLLLWWDGLNVIQQRMPKSKTLLVEGAEAALLMQYETAVQAGLAMNIQERIGKMGEKK